MASSLPPVHALLLNWNGWRDTVECLDSLFAGDYPDLRVIVCDNASTDGSVERIREWAEGTLEVRRRGPLAGSGAAARRPVPLLELSRAEAEAGGTPDDDEARLIVIRTGGNLGFAGGNNVGLRYLLKRRAPGYVWLLNNDTVVAPEALRRMVERAEGDPSLGAVGATVREYHDPLRVELIGGARVQRHGGFPMMALNREVGAREGQGDGTIDFVAGTCLLARREVYERVGLIDERYFLYCEDTDWSMRVREAGLALGYAPRAVVWHKGGGSVGHRSALHDYYVVKSGLLYAHRFHRAQVPGALVHSALRILLPKLLRRDWARARAVAQAYRDFVRQVRAAPERAVLYGGGRG